MHPHLCPISPEASVLPSPITFGISGIATLNERALIFLEFICESSEKYGACNQLLCIFGVMFSKNGILCL